MELKMELVTEMQASLRHMGGVPRRVKDKRPVKDSKGGDNRRAAMVAWDPGDTVPPLS
jgi:hypothetical protein